MRFSSCFQNTLSKLILLGAAFVFLSSAVHIATAQNNGSKKARESLIPEAEKLLTDLGYWIKKVGGKQNDSAYHAITAFQKVEGRRRTGVLIQEELDAMRLASRAIHGSLSIPFLPASHRCVRIPNFAAEEFSRLVWVGMNVFVYD